MSLDNACHTWALLQCSSFTFTKRRFTFTTKLHERIKRINLLLPASSSHVGSDSNTFKHPTSNERRLLVAIGRVSQPSVRVERASQEAAGYCPRPNECRDRIRTLEENQVSKSKIQYLEYCHCPDVLPWLHYEHYERSMQGRRSRNLPSGGWDPLNARDCCESEGEQFLMYDNS